ncbi:MAG TPA: hydrogenase maturation protease [Bryobacteraceae bacterium]|nr:hydrogenase maturation protease [Bryobacteraceae bacterium]
MAALVVAVGNTLRGDDGVAHRVADLLGAHAGVDLLRVHQLTPELAEEIGRAGVVVFVDADMEASAARLERVTETPQRAPITHMMTPNELVMLAGRLYGFQGEAYLCHVPAEDFTPGSALTPVAEAGARAAVRKVAELLNLPAEIL